MRKRIGTSLPRFDPGFSFSCLEPILVFSRLLHLSIRRGTQHDSRSSKRSISRRTPSRHGSGPLTASLTKAGIEVVVEAGAGLEAGYLDEAYVEKGAKIASRDEVFAADVVFSGPHGWCRSRSGRGRPAADEEGGGVVVGMADPLGCPDAAKKMAVKRARHSLPWNWYRGSHVPRAWTFFRRWPRWPVIGPCCWRPSPCPRCCPMMMTAAGTIAPARVFVVGAGVAGLQAIASAKRPWCRRFCLRRTTGGQRAGGEPGREVPGNRDGHRRGGRQRRLRQASSMTRRSRSSRN